MILQKGVNTFLQQITDVQLKLYWETSSVFPLCLLLDESGEVHQVISGQEEDPFSIQHAERHADYTMNLNTLPAVISKIVFACIKSAGKVGFSVENIRYEMNHLTSDSASVLGEIYRYKNGWKIRAVGETVKGGRKELLQLYHFSEIEPAPAPPKIVTVIDSSIHAQEFFQAGKLEKLFKDIFIASSILNPLLEMDVYFFAVLHKRGDKATKENFQDYIENYYPKPGYFNGLGLENDELPVLDKLLGKYKDTETIFYFISSGNISDPDSLFGGLKDTSGFWEIIVLNEEWVSGSTYKNVKIIPYQILSGKKAGEIHQTLLKPISIWRTQNNEALVQG